MADVRPGRSMSDRLKIGVIGVGHLGRAHVRILSGIQECELVGCHDIVFEKAEQAAEGLGFEAFATAAELIDRCDAISLVVPTSEHHKCGMDVLKAGKHLFVEKPISDAVEDARELSDYADDMNLKLAVGHIERFSPVVKAMAGRIGYPSFIEAHRLAPFNFRGLDVAVVFDLMIHDIDLCLYLTGSNVVDIQASAAAVVSDHMDIANARLTFESGCVANLTASRISPNGMRKIRIFQPAGYISMDLAKLSADVYRLIERDEVSPDSNGFSTSVDFGETGRKITFSKPTIESYDMLTAELMAFIESVVNDSPVACSGKEAITALSIAADIERIAEIGLSNLRSHLK
jgi:predicted dehydrogenase